MEAYGFILINQLEVLKKFFGVGNVPLSQRKIKYLGLNKADYDNLKWEDEPVEVFVNMED